MEATGIRTLRRGTADEFVNRVTGRRITAVTRRPVLGRGPRSLRRGPTLGVAVNLLLGLLSEPVGLRVAFLVPVAFLLLTLPVVRHLRRLTGDDDAPCDEVETRLRDAGVTADPLFRQREIALFVDGLNAQDFGQYINFVTVQMRKKHATGDVTGDGHFDTLASTASFRRVQSASALSHICAR